MYAHWLVRVGSEVSEIAGLDGFFDSQNTSPDSDPVILPFLYQSAGGRDCGKCGVFQQYGLSAEAARLHVTCYVFIHFYSGFRRVGDLQHNIEMQAETADVHLFCISIEDTKKSWIERMKSGQVVGVEVSLVARRGVQPGMAQKDQSPSDRMTDPGSCLDCGVASGNSF